MNAFRSNKTPLLLAALLAILVGGYFLFVFPNFRKSAAAKEVAFAIADTASVTRIVLTDQLRGETLRRVTLDRNAPDTWTMNGTYPALTARVRRLLQVMAQIHVKEALAAPGLETARQIVDLRRVHVEVFAKNKRVKSYFLSTEAKDGRGSLMMMDGAQKPYIVSLPGHQGFINGFFHPDTLLWRENLLFDLSPDRLAEFSVSFPESSTRNISLRWTAGRMLLPPDLAAPDTSRLHAFERLFVGKIFAESFVTGWPQQRLDSLFALSPDVQIKVKNTSGSVKTLSLIDRKDENPNSYYGWLEEEKELLTVQRFVIDKFIRTRAELLPDQPSSRPL